MMAAPSARLVDAVEKKFPTAAAVEFPQLPGRTPGREPGTAALEFVKTVTHVMALDAATEPAVAHMRKTLLQVPLPLS